MLNWINKKRNKKGFTLVELVVVIAILGILSAIAIPSFADLRDTSAIKADAATASSIISAARIQETESGVEVTSLDQSDATKTAADGVLQKSYMIVPAPQTKKATDAGIAFGIAKTTGVYEVTWTASGLGNTANNKAYKLIENKPFDPKELDS